MGWEYCLVVQHLLRMCEDQGSISTAIKTKELKEESMCFRWVFFQHKTVTCDIKVVFDFFKIYFYLYVYKYFTCMCVCATCMCSACGGQKRANQLLKWSYRWWCPATWQLGTEVVFKPMLLSPQPSPQLLSVLLTFIIYCLWAHVWRSF